MASSSKDAICRAKSGPVFDGTASVWLGLGGSLDVSSECVKGLAAEVRVFTIRKEPLNASI